MIFQDDLILFLIQETQKSIELKNNVILFHIQKHRIVPHSKQRRKSQFNSFALISKQSKNIQQTLKIPKG